MPEGTGRGTEHDGHAIAKLQREQADALVNDYRGEIKEETSSGMEAKKVKYYNIDLYGAWNLLRQLPRSGSRSWRTTTTYVMAE